MILFLMLLEVAVRTLNVSRFPSSSEVAKADLWLSSGWEKFARIKTQYFWEFRSFNRLYLHGGNWNSLPLLLWKRLTHLHMQLLPERGSKQINENCRNKTKTIKISKCLLPCEGWWPLIGQLKCRLDSGPANKLPHFTNEVLKYSQIGPHNKHLV